MEDKRHHDYKEWYSNTDVLYIFRFLFFLKVFQLQRLIDPITYWKDRLANSLDQWPIWRKVHIYMN